MAVTQNDVMRWLSPEEPDYVAAAAELGQEAAPVLVAMARGDDPFLAARAVSLAAAIGGACARDVVVAAHAHPSPVVRTQVAAAARALPAEVVAPMLGAWLRDGDVSVRKFALASASQTGVLDRDASLREAVERMQATDAEDFLRTRATQVLRTP